MESKTVQTVLYEMSEILKDKIPRAQRDAQILLMHHLGQDELWLITHQKSEVKHLDKLYEMLARRAKNEPLEYITKRVSFYSQEFFIQEGALIPRPETELLIDEVIQRVPQRETKMTFVEVGVGSGIISIILASHFKNAKFIK